MSPDFPEENGDFKSPPLLGVCGIGKKGFWSVVNGLTSVDQGSRCNGEWRKRLVKVKRNWGITMTMVDREERNGRVHRMREACTSVEQIALAFRSSRKSIHRIILTSH